MENLSAPTLARPVTARSLLLVLAVSTLALAPGCATKKPETLPGITKDVDQPDIPVIPGFERKPNSSWVWEEYLGTPGHFRSWQTEYVGLTKRRKVVDWYGKRMPEQGWLLKSSHGGGASKNVMMYTKSNVEDAVITIFEEFFPKDDVFKTIVRAEIKPTAQDELQVEEVLAVRGRATTRALPAAARTGSSFPVEPAPLDDAGENGTVGETGGLISGDR